MPDMDDLDMWEGELATRTPPRLMDYCGRCGKLDPDGAHGRYYCPLCHEVTCGMCRQGEWIALPHYRNGGRGRMDKIPCRGGPIDPKEDKAP